MQFDHLNEIAHADELEGARCPSGLIVIVAMSCRLTLKLPGPRTFTISLGPDLNGACRSSHVRISITIKHHNLMDVESPSRLWSAIDERP